MVTTCYFVRHAEPNYDNHNDYERELSEKGERDRHLVTAFLEDKGITAIYSSPYVRAKETVRPLADKLGLAVIERDDFRERKITTDWIEDFQAFSQQQWADFSYKLADGESLSEVATRNIAALEQLLEEHEGQNLVVGSHGTALSTIINHYDKTFAYADFERVKGLMPWIVVFRFEGKTCLSIEEVNLFEL
ncbi:histidine phosphatase family protein [Streptococcus loxodontisalivarius]|uniref:2,3-bisphosphoglycerate-dependent phosphoglycerate mutase n=1 Tax=Streptococcus loxodontisalivarius TaxID=1349415 RepID=A0ABS2PQQ4_9STRE|nr:histidine phosphatase family protein [Streptococcus loxodontisalivarius]MBM7642320.1 2,3-bisphosphoglycerate-dependent phosphoglycerate mutase [Streptococcus loxodontisalivarius]